MNAKKFLLLLDGVVAVALFYHFGLVRFLTLGALKENRQELLD